jgi:hypothetical protein
VNRQAHDAGTVAKARVVYEARGSRAASEQTGIPRRSINAMAKRHRWQHPGVPEQPRHQRVAPVAGADGGVAKAVRAGWQPRLLLSRLTAEVWIQLDTLAELRAAGKARDARETAVTLGILVDKAVALAKQTGADRMHPDPATSVARIHELLDGIEQRRTVPHA